MWSHLKILSLIPRHNSHPERQVALSQRELAMVFSYFNHIQVNIPRTRDHSGDISVSISVMIHTLCGNTSLYPSEFVTLSFNYSYYAHITQPHQYDATVVLKQYLDTYQVWAEGSRSVDLSSRWIWNFWMPVMPSRKANPCRGTFDVPVTNCSRHARSASSNARRARQNHWIWMKRETLDITVELLTAIHRRLVILPKVGKPFHFRHNFIMKQNGYLPVCGPISQHVQGWHVTWDLARLLEWVVGLDLFKTSSRAGDLMDHNLNFKTFWLVSHLPTSRMTPGNVICCISAATATDAYLQWIRLVLVVLCVRLQVVYVDCRQSWDEQLELLLVEYRDESFRDDVVESLEERVQLLADCSRHLHLTHQFDILFLAALQHLDVAAVGHNVTHLCHSKLSDLPWRANSLAWHSNHLCKITVSGKSCFYYMFIFKVIA